MKRKYMLNENFFDIIDTEEKAYFLGFIYGDGYNSGSKNCIKIRLHKKDEELLLKFIKLLYPNNDKCLYYYKKNNEVYSCELVIESKHMSNILNEYGCIQNKSKNIYYPNCIPESLANHFIRGVFDADGTIHFSRLKSGKEKGTLKAYFSIIGYIKFIEQIQEKMILNIDIKKNKLIKSKAKDIYSLMYSGIKQTIKIMDWIYKDSTIFLERKHKKYLELKECLLSTKSNIKPDIFCHICNCNLKNRKTYKHDEKVYCYKCFSSFNINREKIRKRKNIKDYNVEYKDNYCICYINNNQIFIDIDDVDKLLNNNYHIENGYLVHTIRINKKQKKVIYLQKEILKGNCIGFKNGNKLDVRKENLYVRY